MDRTNGAGGVVAVQMRGEEGSGRGEIVLPPTRHVPHDLVWHIVWQRKCGITLVPPSTFELKRKNKR